MFTNRIESESCFVVDFMASASESVLICVLNMLFISLLKGQVLVRCEAGQLFSFSPCVCVCVLSREVIGQRVNKRWEAKNGSRRILGTRNLKKFSNHEQGKLFLSHTGCPFPQNTSCGKDFKIPPSVVCSQTEPRPHMAATSCLPVSRHDSQ